MLTIEIQLNITIPTQKSNLLKYIFPLYWLLMKDVVCLQKRFCRFAF